MNLFGMLSVFCYCIYIRSTVILAAGLLTAVVLRRRGAAVESIVLRWTLAAVLAVPFTTLFQPSDLTKITVDITPVIEKPSHRAPAVINDRFESRLPDNGLREPEKPVAAPDKVSRRMRNKNPESSAKPQIYRNPPEYPAPELHTITNIVTQNTERSEPVFHVPDDGKITNIIHTIAGKLGSTAVYLWCGVSIVLFIRWIGANSAIVRLRKNACPAKPWFQEECRSAAIDMGIDPPEVLQSISVESPVIAGIFRPFILLPLGMRENDFGNRDVFLHELTHLKRRDFLWNQLRMIGSAIIPFHPFIWALSRRIEETADYVCDDHVLRYIGNGRKYAIRLMSFSRHYRELCETTNAGVGFLSFPSMMKRRIGRILDGSRRLSLAGARGSMTTSAFVSVTATVVAAFIGVQTGVLSAHTVLFRKQGASLTINTGQTVVPSYALVQKTKGGFYSINHSRNGRNGPDTINRSSGIEDEHFNPSGTESLHVHQKSSATMKLFSGVVTKQDKTTVTFTGRANTDEHYAQASVSGSHPEIKQESGASSNQGLSHDAGPFVTGNESMEPLQPGNITLAENSLSGTAEESIGGENVAGAISHDLPPGPVVPVYSGSTIKMPAPQALDVTVEYDYENHAFNYKDKEDKRLYSLYHGLDKLKNEPAWSPDGSLIAFTDHNRIWIVPAGGGVPVLVYENCHDGYPVGNIQSLCFTPDGQEITFKKDVFDTERGSVVNINMNGSAIFSNPIPNIESVDIETGAHHIIVEEASDGAWSPDGRFLCYLTWSMDAERDNIPMMFDTETGVTIPLRAGDGIRYGRPDFLPDGSGVIIPVREGNGPIELFRIPLDGGRAEQLTVYFESDGFGKYRNFPACSPDGNWILYTDFTWKKNTPDKRLFVHYLPTGEQFEVFPNQETRNSYGRWSPDGSKICYLVENDDGNYIYICDFVPEVYGVEKPASAVSESPRKFSLSMNYPNPFNMSTAMDISLPDDGDVSLVIYNTSGQTVRRLLTGSMTGGVHRVIWDGRDDDGREVSSGIYLSCLISGDRIATTRMTFVK